MNITNLISNLFKPSCPLLPKDKQWVEIRLNWLGKEFGYYRFIENSGILPTKDNFPIDYDGSDEALVELFLIVCRYLEIDPYKVNIRKFRDETRVLLESGVRLNFGSYSIGRYEPGFKPTVYVEESIVKTLDLVIAVLAHELSHHLLIHSGLSSVFSPDDEALTDLTAIFFGMGVFIVNRAGRLPLLSGDKRYMSRTVAAYALAHHAWARDEKIPEWLKYIRGEARSWCKTSIKFLLKTDETFFRPPPRLMIC